MDAVALETLHSAWWIALAAMAAPLLAWATGKKVPDVVWLLVLGLLMGPSVLDLAHTTAGIAFVRELGLGLLFFIAGTEINLEQLVDKAGKHARITYLVGLALGIGAGFLISGGQVGTAIALGIALTSTALGTLLPILKDGGLLDTPLGGMTMRHGAVGELGPIIAMTLLLSARAPWQSAGILLAFVVISALVVYLPAHVFRKIPFLGRAMINGVNTTAQTALRFSMLILITLMLLTAIMDLDIVLGAFAAGLLIGRLVSIKPQAKHAYVAKLETLGFSFLIPVFFVTSGMSIDAHVITSRWPTILLAVATILIVRGATIFLLETRRTPSLPRPQQAALALYGAVGLPIIVAVTEVATHSELMNESDASVLVAAGAVTVLLFPLIADAILRRHPTPEEAA